MERTKAARPTLCMTTTTYTERIRKANLCHVLTATSYVKQLGSVTRSHFSYDGDVCHVLQLTDGSLLILHTGDRLTKIVTSAGQTVTAVTDILTKGGVDVVERTTDTDCIGSSGSHTLLKGSTAHPLGMHNGVQTMLPPDIPLERLCTAAGDRATTTQTTIYGDGTAHNTTQVREVHPDGSTTDWHSVWKPEDGPTLSEEEERLDDIISMATPRWVAIRTNSGIIDGL